MGNATLAEVYRLSFRVTPGIHAQKGRIHAGQGGKRADGEIKKDTHSQAKKEKESPKSPKERDQRRAGPSTHVCVQGQVSSGSHAIAHLALWALSNQPAGLGTCLRHCTKL